MRGRQIRVPKGDRVRPTTDRVREALFSILGARIEGVAFLDLFAGSGAVGLGAWSRGARPVWWVEQHPASLAILKRNVGGLCDEGARVVRGNAVKFLKKGLVPHRFDIIFSDPPYEKGQRPSVIGQGGGKGKGKGKGQSEQGEAGGVLGGLLRAVTEGGVLAEDGLFVVEQRAKTAYRAMDGWELVRERCYGMSCLRILRQVRKGGNDDSVGHLCG